MSRNLTGKQAKFALEVAMGKSLADSYREAYGPSNPTARSVYTNSQRARRHPLVSQRIAELEMQLMPGPEDMKAARQHALAVGLQLTVVAKDERVRLRAAQFVAAEAAKSEKLEEEERKAEGRPQVIAELKGLYRKALGSAKASVVEPTKGEQKTEDIPGAGDHEAFAPQAQSGLELVEEPEPAETENSEPPAPRYEWVERCVSKPGHFPPQFQYFKVRVS